MKSNPQLCRMEPNIGKLEDIFNLVRFAHILINYLHVKRGVNTLATSKE